MMSNKPFIHPLSFHPAQGPPGGHTDSPWTGSTFTGSKLGLAAQFRDSYHLEAGKRRAAAWGNLLELERRLPGPTLGIVVVLIIHNPF